MIIIPFVTTNCRFLQLTLNSLTMVAYCQISLCKLQHHCPTSSCNFDLNFVVQLHRATSSCDFSVQLHRATSSCNFNFECNIICKFNFKLHPHCATSSSSETSTATPTSSYIFIVQPRCCNFNFKLQLHSV